MNKCTRVRALRSCSGDVHVARVVVSLVHAVVGLTLGLIAHVVVVVFVVEFPYPFLLYLEVYSLHTRSMMVNCVGCYRICQYFLHQPNHCFRKFPRSISAGYIVAVMLR